MDKQDKGRLLGLAAAVGLIVLVVSRPAPAPSAAEAEDSRPAPTPGEKCKGYKGEARNFAGLVKQNLRNPDSFEHVQTSYGPVDDGAMVATMQYRATNGFGAVDTFMAIGEVDAFTCGARVLIAE